MTSKIFDTIFENIKKNENVCVVLHVLSAAGYALFYCDPWNEIK